MLATFSCPLCLVPLDHAFFSDHLNRHVFVCIQCRRVLDYREDRNELLVSELSAESLTALLTLKLAAKPTAALPLQKLSKQRSA